LAERLPQDTRLLSWLPDELQRPHEAVEPRHATRGHQGVGWKTRAAARSQGIAEPNGVARGHPEARGQIATGPLGTNPLLVDMPNDDAAPVNVGADAASQLHIVEKDYGHALLAL
jgi:hypothetical protein